MRKKQTLLTLASGGLLLSAAGAVSADDMESRLQAMEKASQAMTQKMAEMEQRLVQTNEENKQLRKLVATKSVSQAAYPGTTPENSSPLGAGTHAGEDKALNDRLVKLEQKVDETNIVAQTASKLTKLATSGDKATIHIDDEKSLSIGFGLRTSFANQGKGAPDGHSSSNSFSVENMRLYLSGTFNRYLKGTFNSEKKADGSINVLNAYAQIEPMNELNLWAGRVVAPTDRANLDGPYYNFAWEYPGVASRYPTTYSGQSDGATVWGKFLDKKLVYAVGAFTGHNQHALASNSNGQPQFAGRVSYNFWDAEPAPGYYVGSTYFGAVDVFTIGVAGMYQNNGVGNNITRAPFSAWNIDALVEKNFNRIGVLTLDGAYYQYRTGNINDVNTTAINAVGDIGGLRQGDAYLAGGAFLLPEKFGWGKFQPYVRYQRFEDQLANNNINQYDLGLNYVINANKAKISLTYSRLDQTLIADTNKIVLGTQVQF